MKLKSAGNAPWIFAAIILIAASLLSQASRLRAEGGEPRYFAITNARIVPVSGPVLESGTVVIANGLIQSVGATASAKIPAEAWVIDGKGLTVYPGLIDAGNDLGITKPDAPAGEARGRGRRRGAAPIPEHISTGPEDRPSTSPWIVASDDLNAADKRIESWRDAGFTTALVLPEEAIIAGQGSLIDLNDERVSQMIVRSHAALRIGLRPETFGFPDSLMGVISYLRQVNDDTAWYDEAAPTYAAHPNGIERPNVDRTEEIMTLILHRKEPVLFPANTLVEIPRAMRLAQEWNLHAVLYGGQQSYEVADLIAAKKYQVIVNLKWPEGPKDPDPENIPSLRELRFRDRAPGSPAALAKVGVKFAFSSGGLADPKEIQKNVRRAATAGLSSDAALRAFTLDAAEILGVSDRLGSIEPGKIANLVIADGDLFAEKTKVKHVFVDGRHFEIHEVEMPHKPGEKPGESPQESNDDPEVGR
jgi:imidazolonepropionase-like amidohydrolase